jgi:hypothetical protein
MTKHKTQTRFSSRGLLAVSAAAAFIFTAVSGMSTLAIASELDNEKAFTNMSQRAAELPGTVVVRVSQSNPKDVAVLHVEDRLKPGTSTQKLVSTSSFETMPLTGQMTREIDQGSSTSSWYFWFNHGSWYAPTYYYSGYTYSYTNYWSVGWGGYNYWYYGWGKWW